MSTGIAAHAKYFRGKTHALPCPAMRAMRGIKERDTRSLPGMKSGNELKIILKAVPVWGNVCLFIKHKEEKIMLDLLKKSILTGVGLALMTKDKAEELAKELVKKGELSEKEGKEFIDEMLKKSKQAGKDMEAKVDDLVKKALKKANVATREDLAGLEKEIKRLKKETHKE